MNAFVKFRHFCKKRLHGLAQQVIKSLFKYAKIDAKSIFYESSGILKYKGKESGEEWFVVNVLNSLLGDIESPILIDIGANVGNYSLCLAETFPEGKCYAIEPNPIAFQILVEQMKSFENVFPLNCGAGSSCKASEIYVRIDDYSTVHASLYQDVFLDLHHSEKDALAVLACQIDTIDNMLDNKVIPEEQIHYIKIDTEGHEFEGLRGAMRTITQRGVRVIQFEFNEMNVVSRVFLKDFYQLLGMDWDFYRLDTRCLIPLGAYNSENEIFKFQNVIAVRSQYRELLRGARFAPA